MGFLSDVTGMGCGGQGAQCPLDAFHLEIFAKMEKRRKKGNGEEQKENWEKEGEKLF